MSFESNKRWKSDDALYPYWINFYNSPPLCKITIKEIEECVIDRFNILNTIGKLSKEMTKRNRKFHDTLEDKLVDLNNFYLHGKDDSDSTIKKRFDARRYDHISHYLLRLVFCQSEELKRLFVNRETDLFRQRFIQANLDDDELQKCLQYFGFNYEILSCNDHDKFYNQINWTSFQSKNECYIVFKIPFSETLDLVRFRSAFLHKGYAYIRIDNILSVLINRFRSRLYQELKNTLSELDRFEEPRLLEYLRILKENNWDMIDVKKPTQLGDNPQKLVSRLSKDDIEKYYCKHYPPCMRKLHETLSQDHHLRYYGRLYYSLFLKSSGLPLDESIEFFRSKLTSQNVDIFHKDYAYTLRHIYGKEGRKKPMFAYSCHKIIHNNPPGPLDKHGCPFKHYDETSLRALVVSYGINKKEEIDNILDLAKIQNNPSAACSKYFCCKSGSKEIQISHPNQFFRESRKQSF